MGRNKEHKREYDKNRYPTIKKDKQIYDKNRYEQLKINDKDFLKNIAQKRREEYRLNPQRKKEIEKRWKLNHRDQVKTMGRDWCYRKKYGITLLDYNKTLAEQNSVCILCGAKTAYQKKGRNLVVDHDHKTGKVRGLLCSRCNTMIGHVEVIGLEKVIRYLSKSLS